jgi:hypothetical protein
LAATQYAFNRLATQLTRRPENYSESEYGQVRKAVLLIKDAKAANGVIHFSAAQFESIVEASVVMLNARDKFLGGLKNLNDVEFNAEAKDFGDSPFYIRASDTFQIALPGEFGKPAAGGDINYYYYGMLSAKAGRVENMASSIMSWNKMQGMLPGRDMNTEMAQASRALKWAQFGVNYYNGRKP